MISGGSVAKTTRASSTSMTSSATMMPKKVTTETKAVTRPVCRKVDRASTSVVILVMIRAGQLALVVVEPEALELGEDLQPQRVQDPLAGTAGHPGLADLGHPLHGHGEQGEQGGRPDRAERAPA